MAKTKVEKLTDIQSKEVGYLEKKSNKDLDSKTGNAGSNNYTKYARDLINTYGNMFCNGVPWCVEFQTWCIMKAFGASEAKKLLYNTLTMSCGTLRDAFKANNAYVKSNPQAGDLVIFEWRNSKGEVCRHIGYVYKVDSNNIYTIEGNTSSGSNVVANGGGVFKKSYPKNKDKIDGYCRLKIHDGEKPKKTIAKPTLKKGDKNSEVKVLQTNLNDAGIKGSNGKKLSVDGSFGSDTLYAVKEFQKKYKLAVDGSYGPKTADKIDKVLNG